MKKFVVAIGLLFGALFGAQLGFGGGVPFLPATSQFSEASQIVGTINALINQLNGNAIGSGGYAVQPGGIVSLGSFCNASAAGSLAVTCNGQRGKLVFTGEATIAAGGVQNVVLTDSSISASSSCQATIDSGLNVAANSGLIVLQHTYGAGSDTITLQNPTATATGAATAYTIVFNCIN